MGRAADIIWCSSCAEEEQSSGWSYTEVLSAAQEYTYVRCGLCGKRFDACDLLEADDEGLMEKQDRRPGPPPEEQPAEGWWDEADSPAFLSQVITISPRDDKPDQTLNNEVKAFLEKANANTPRRLHRVDGFHASELGARWCGRYAAFKRLLPRSVDGKQFGGTLLLRFEMGRAAHHHWQNSVYGKMRILKGTWVCSRCSHRVKGYMPKDPCPKCRWPVNPGLNIRAPRSSRSKRCADYCVWEGGFDNPERDCALCEIGGEWHFRETFIEIPELGIVGKFDGILTYRGQECVLEFKTLRSEDFPILKPKEDHVIQCNIYMRATGMKHGVVIYLNKNTGETTEFPIEPDPRVDTLIKHRTQSVIEAVSKGELPHGTCSSPRSMDAKVCPYRDVCFGGHDTIDQLKESMEV